MKRLLSATLALTLLGGSAAVAAPADHGDRGYNSGYDNRGDNDRARRGDNAGAAVAVGLSIFALALLASQNHDHYNAGWYNHDGRGYHGYDRNHGRFGHGDRRW